MTKLRLVTHNGSFHADDLFACATLILYFKKQGRDFEIIRSRDVGTINNADYVFDVGGVYDPQKNRFDHHQKGGSGVRANGIEYASFGLVWKHFGIELCDQNEEVWLLIDKEIASPIDANDNGQDLINSKYKDIFPYNGARPFLIFSPTWQEDATKIDDTFRSEAQNVARVLEREIKVAKDDILGRQIIEESYQKAEDKRLIEIKDGFPRYLYQSTLSKFPEPLYALYQSHYGESWKLEAIQKNPNTLESRKSFPQEWCTGVSSDPEIIKMTGVPDIIFCHRGGFLLNTKSKESALQLAKMALEYTHKKKFNLFKWRS